MPCNKYIKFMFFCLALIMIAAFVADIIDNLDFNVAQYEKQQAGWN